MSRVTEWVDSLEEHEGPMTERERYLCTTLLHGLAASGHLTESFEVFHHEVLKARHLTLRLFDVLDGALKGPNQVLLEKAELRELQTLWHTKARSDRHRKPARPEFGGEDG